MIGFLGFTSGRSNVTAERDLVLMRWQLAQTISHLAISATRSSSFPLVTNEETDPTLRVLV